MSHIAWNDSLSTGINIIDCQHKRIIRYINQLNDAKSHDNTHELISEVLIELIDYTLSHFAFEESLMDDAGYSGVTIHKRTHDAFREKIQGYQSRHQSGEDVSDELLKLLNVWLINHIANDDSDYVSTVKENITGINSAEKENWLKIKVRQYFN